MDHKHLRDSSPVVSDDDMEVDENQPGYELGIAAPSNGKSCLPSPVGVPMEVDTFIDDVEECHIGVPALLTDVADTLASSLRLVDIIIDESVRRAVNKWFDNNGFIYNQYWDEDANFRVDDDELLPLARMDNMMSHTFIPPPIVLRPRGARYTYDNGRHRHARLLIMSMCNPDRVLVRSQEYIIEKNPGPPKPRQAAPKRDRAGPRKTDANRGHIAEDRVVLAFRLTQVYVRGRDTIYPDIASRDRFNNWVRANQAQIDPAEMFVCKICGEASLLLCDHAIREAVVPLACPPPVQAPTYRYLGLRRLWYHNSKFNFGEQNARDVRHFDNSQISDVEIIPECYNYITSNMQTSYDVAGKDSRELRLSHCHRLAGRWAELAKVKDRLMEDTWFKNRLLFTAQRACDQVETTMLYKFTDPTTQNFGLARQLQEFVLFTTGFSALVVVLLVCGVTALEFLLLLLQNIALGLSPWGLISLRGKIAMLACRIYLSKLAHDTQSVTVRVFLLCFTYLTCLVDARA
ncbi:hypothetical protein 1 [Hubei tombus-like virus 32]|uniref:hypothetical protein 1 n=1 Tax=Hubei tombus-like virus 32 TaxID=1923280 RepID=UPI00090A32B6|nr:hypothetical protein 1 [Hubei tombus-like virus 32]APG76500.1 hypothetical protein 1 [Hubei tombus-like virus 32]